MCGETVGIREDTRRIRKPFKRLNRHSKAEELFDPHQIFCSPSIRYCDLPQYAKVTRFVAESGCAYKAKVAFQLRLRPGTYAVGQQTVGAEGAIDPYISNDSIEWYTKGTEHASHVLTGLMVKLMPN